MVVTKTDRALAAVRSCGLTTIAGGAALLALLDTTWVSGDPPETAGSILDGWFAVAAGTCVTLLLLGGVALARPPAARSSEWRLLAAASAVSLAGILAGTAQTVDRLAGRCLTPGLTDQLYVVNGTLQRQRSDWQNCEVYATASEAWRAFPLVGSFTIVAVVATGLVAAARLAEAPTAARRPIGGPIAATLGGVVLPVAALALLWSIARYNRYPFACSSVKASGLVLLLPSIAGLALGGWAGIAVVARRRALALPGVLAAMLVDVFAIMISLSMLSGALCDVGD